MGGQGGWWAWSPGWLSWSPAAIPPTTKPQSTTSTAPQSTTTSQVKTTSVMILTKRLCHIPSNHIATSKQWISSEEHRWQRKAQRGFKHLTKGVILNLFNVLLDNGAADLDHEEDVNYIFLTCPHPSFWCVQFVSKILQSWLDSIAVSQLKQEKYFSTPKTVSEQKIQITLSNLYGRFYWAVMSQWKTQNTFLICKSSSLTRKVVRAELENPAMISRIGFRSTNRICASEDPVYISHEYTRYDSFSDVGESRVWFASINLTPCRMHWNAFLIAQIIAKCHSFPNMYGML